MSSRIINHKLTYCARKTLIRATRRNIFTGRVVPEIDQDLGEDIKDGRVHPKKISTRRNFGMTFLPARLQAIVEDEITSFSDRQFRSEARYLISVMKNIKLPDDTHTLKVKKADIKTELEVRGKKVPEEYHKPDEILKEEYDAARSRLSQIILGALDERRRDWHYYEYDQRAAYMYMAARFAPNYSCITNVMQDIKKSYPTFMPKSVLDFGSGMGTVGWVVNELWPDSVSEFVNVDLSKEQQYLNERLLRNCNDLAETPPGIFYRQYLPTSNKVKYDMVVSAFSLLELPTRELRTHIIENLWHKTNDLLVIIERGNQGGFTTVSEARHLVLDLCGHDVTNKIHLAPETRPIFKHKIPQCHVMGPCSHEFICPRLNMTSKNNMDVCRFRAFYMPLNFGEMRPGFLPEQYSYVVLRKKSHQTYFDSQCTIRWPRIVEKRKKAGRQITHRLCSPNGTLSETTISKGKHDKSTWELAKACDWGDVLPVKVCDDYVVKNSKRLADK